MRKLIEQYMLSGSDAELKELSSTLECYPFN